MKIRVFSRIAATLAGALLLSHCAQAPVSSSKRVEPPPAEQQEPELGVAARQALLQEYATLDNPALQAYVDEVGQRLARQSPRAGLAWHFTVVDSADVNAFSLPGGDVYITRGMLAYLNSEAELAAVIGHEIGHVSARDSAQVHDVPAAAGLGSVLAPETDSLADAPQLRALSQALTAGYGRERELDADRRAAGYLAGAGYRPQAVSEVVGALQAQARFAAARAGGKPRPYHGILGLQADDGARLAQAVDEAAARDVADPREGRDDYLTKLAGLAFGDSPEQGVIRNNRLLHERLGLAIQFPQGWQVDNRPDRVLATSPAGDALLELQQGPKRGLPLETLQNGVKLDAGARYDSGRLGGYPAAFAAGAQAGKPVVVAAIAVNGTQYLIAGMTRDTVAYGRQRSALRATINSFHALTRAEKKAARSNSLQLVRVQAGQTLAGLARKSPLGSGAESRLRVLNGLSPSDEPEAGQLIKIVQ